MNIYKKSTRKALGLVSAIALAASSLALTGCDDFLDEPVQGNSTDKNYYDTAYKLQSALNATYDILQSDAMQDTDWRFGEACGDDMAGNDEGLTSHMGQLVNFQFNTSNPYILNRWTIYYKAIHRANQVIANVDRVRLSNHETDDFRNVRYILAQAKFLRAYFYFNLVRTFGGVPIRPEVETVEKLVVPRSSLEDCYAYIEKDLREALIMLPPRFNDNNAGKVSAGACAALLMKVLMYQAKPGDGSIKWKQCAEIGDYFVAKKPMTFGQMLKFDERYPDTDWETLREKLWFKPVWAFAENETAETLETQCPEMGNAYRLDYEDSYGNPLTYYEQFYIAGEFCAGSIWEIVFKESGDGTGGDTNEGTGIYWNLFGANWNPALKTTEKRVGIIFGTDVRGQYVLTHNNQTPDGSNILNGPGNWSPLKWWTPKMDQPTYSDDSGKNRRVLRYAEAVLTYAEALNESGRPQEALVQLNANQTQVGKINNRNFNTPAGGYGYLRDAIWKERRMELAFEWDRFFDIVRQGRAAALIHAYASDVINHRGQLFREGVNEIFPIPQTEIDISNGVVTQNPGY